MAKEMWFGNAEKMRWVPCPAIDMGASKNHWSSRSDYLNGGIGFRRSATGAMVYEMNWNLTSEVELDKVEGFYEGVWGEGPFYFLDPQAMNTNVFPAAWAQPRVALVDGTPLVFDQKPIKVVGGSSMPDAPNVGVQYTVTEDSAPQVLTIPIPEGHKFIFSVFQDPATSAYVSYSQDGMTPVRASKHTLTAASGGSIVRFTISGTGTVRVYAMMGQIVPVSVPTPVYVPGTDYAWVGTPDASVSTETVSGVVTRRNLMLRPEPTGSGSAGWAPTSTSAWPAVFAPGEGRNGRDAVKAVRSATSPSSAISQISNIGASAGSATSTPQVEGGKTYTFSVYVRTSLAAWQWQPGVYWYDADGAAIGTIEQGPVTAAVLDEGGWARTTHTVTAPAGAAYANVRLTLYTTAGNAPAGTEAWYTDAQLEEGTEATPWFYGDNPDIAPVDPPFFDTFISGKGNSGVEFETFTRNVYSAALDKVGATATFVEVGSWL